ncbi:MAG TPA: folylpolyglutamate synthase/dihydrofolate synthase family protein [Bacteroidia bacterium]|nr:folylpolyglutamate synthase/dihydrofolate synthase family protein [Bacteroidia bacterium]
MTYQQTLEYLYAKLPMFQRVGAAAYKADLTNTVKIMELLNKPHQKLKCIHVAGTNGKGSSSHMLAAILQHAGYKTGLYTSPHLVDFRERIKINGKMISKNQVVDFVEKYKDAFEEIQPSFFEWTVGLAFDYFAKEEVDVAVIEVGLGGRLDSTNVICPLISLITNISFDHMNLLGDTIPKIAGEKAGIIKFKTPVVISQYQSESASVFMNRARELKSPYEFGDKVYKITESKVEKEFLNVKVTDRKTEKQEIYELDLKGNYQAKNLLGVLCVVEHLKNEGFLIEDKTVKEALKKVIALTGLMGRWQLLSEKPFMIADTGHNEDGIRQVIDNLKKIEYKKLHFVFGAVNDKDVSKILELLPKEAEYYFVKADIPRALPSEELMLQASKAKLKGKNYGDVKSGVEAAKKSAKKDDLILIGGSTFVVADVLQLE